MCRRPARRNGTSSTPRDGALIKTIDKEARRTTRSTPTMAVRVSREPGTACRRHHGRRREDAHRRESRSARSATSCGRSRSTAEQTLVFANVNNLLGFEVADLATGKVLHRVAVEGLRSQNSPVHGTPSHGIAMTADETEIWVADNTNHKLHIFDATDMPPKQKTASTSATSPAGSPSASTAGRPLRPPAT